MKKYPSVFFLLFIIVTLYYVADIHAYVDKKHLREEIHKLYELLSQAQSTEGLTCTPDELALAQTYLTQAHIEFEEGDYWEAEDYIKLARTVYQEMLKQIPGCRNDLDQDRIPDRKDKCKEAPENYNGYLDEDGCTDYPPKRAILTPEKIELLEPILFDTKNYETLPASEPLLKDVVRVLAENPNLRVRVEAHMDDQLPPEEAKKITLEWAMAVKRSLLAHGIQADRIEVKGLGSTEPIAPNSTAWGRETNQRIEFIRLPTI